MAGSLRLDNVRHLVEDVLRRGVPGSFVGALRVLGGQHGAHTGRAEWDPGPGMPQHAALTCRQHTHNRRLPAHPPAECGVWRGGSSLYAKAVLDAHGAVGREVHLVDSFQGLPPPTTDKDELVR